MRVVWFVVTGSLVGEAATRAVIDALSLPDRIEGRLGGRRPISRLGRTTTTCQVRNFDLRPVVWKSARSPRPGWPGSAEQLLFTAAHWVHGGTANNSAATRAYTPPVPADPGPLLMCRQTGAEPGFGGACRIAKRVTYPWEVVSGEEDVGLCA